MTRRLSRASAAVALAIVGLGLTPATAQGPDPRVVAAEGRADVLADLSRHPVCKRPSRPALWAHAAAPDKGRSPPLISAHRGGNTLAPENTLEAYEAAFALGVDFIEVDVRETKDGVFVANHDDTVDRTTDGAGKIADLTLAQIRALNAADYAPWKGGPYDPSRIATLEEVLDLARRAGAGLELDIKISGAHERIAAMVERYGLTKASIFNSQSPDTLKGAPAARLIYNRNSWEPPALLHKVVRASPVVGSRLSEFTPESIVAIHDGCGLAMPHAYDLGPAKEGAQFLEARARGADGVQTNQPELIVALAGRRVQAKLVVSKAAPARVCLVNARNGMGLYGKSLVLANGASLMTLHHGCAALPAGASGKVSFAGDAAVGPARLRLR